MHTASTIFYPSTYTTTATTVCELYVILPHYFPSTPSSGTVYWFYIFFLRITSGSILIYFNLSTFLWDILFFLDSSCHLSFCRLSRFCRFFCRSADFVDFFFGCLRLYCPKSSFNWFTHSFYSSISMSFSSFWFGEAVCFLLAFILPVYVSIIITTVNNNIYNYSYKYKYKKKQKLLNQISKGKKKKKKKNDWQLARVLLRQFNNHRPWVLFWPTFEVPKKKKNNNNN